MTKWVNDEWVNVLEPWNTAAGGEVVFNHEYFVCIAPESLMIVKKLFLKTKNYKIYKIIIELTRDAKNVLKNGRNSQKSISSNFF